MSASTLLSICIPAFGRLEYLRNTLKSIYSIENLNYINFDEFEVIVSDNDPEKGLSSLQTEFNYPNFKYLNTQCEGFMNSYHVLTYGNGEFLKLHNSQELFNKGALIEMLKIIKLTIEKKPILFFSGGYLLKGKNFNSNSFDSFISKTAYFTSWSNGFGIWKEDFLQISTDKKLDKYFPHTSLLFYMHWKKNFKIIDLQLFSTQFVTKRGGHNKFEAFSIHYPSILKEAFKEKYISEKTYKKVLNNILLEYLPMLYFNVKIAKREFFNSENFEENIKKYFPKGAYYIVIILSFIVPFKIICRKIYLRYFIRNSF